MNAPLVKEFHYKAPIHDVWDALTDTDKMRAWYFPQLRQFEPVVGSKFRFEDDGPGYHKEWMVTRVEPGKTLAHSWAYEGYPGSSEVVFDLSAGAAGTTLKVTQTGLDSFPDHPHFRRERFEWGWDNLLGQNLRRLLEGDGKG